MTLHVVNDFSERLTAVVSTLADSRGDVDDTSLIPASHFDALAALGLYGAFAPGEFGGLGLGVKELSDVVEELASGCLATALVLIQHFRLLAAVLDPGAVDFLSARRDRVVAGTLRGGVALGGALPGPARLSATRQGEEWSLSGFAPWVSGWGLINVLIVAARTPDHEVLTVALDAHQQPGLLATPQRLAAINASATVTLSFDALRVAPSRVVGLSPYDPVHESGEGLRVNGSLALGLTRRCLALLGPSGLDEELVSARAELDGADGASMAKARARASELATRAALAVAVNQGSRSVLAGDVAERTIREAALLLTFGSRPAIRASLVARLGDVAN